MNHMIYFSKKMLKLNKKTRSFITFTLLIQMEWIKASHVQKIWSTRKKIQKIQKILFQIFEGFFFCRVMWKLYLTLKSYWPYGGQNATLGRLVKSQYSS